MNRIIQLCMCLCLCCMQVPASLLAAEEDESWKDVEYEASVDEAVYDSVNWIDLNKEKEEDRELDFNFHSLIYRQTEKETLSGDDVTIIETLEVSDGSSDSDDSPIKVLKIE